MKIALPILGLAAGALALAPRATAQEAFAAIATEPTALAVTSELPPVFTAAPYIGVERSTAFRLDATRRLIGDEAEPISFVDQVASGIAAFHLTVYADPHPGAYAHGGGDPALAQAGLKVVDPEAADEDAVCATLMTCLVALDAISRQGTSSPMVVVVDARPQPSPEPKLLRIAAAFIGDPTPAPTWTEILSEIATAAPEIDPERLTLVVTGGAGELPDAEAILGDNADAVFIDGDQARVFRGDAPSSAIQEAAMSGALTVVVGAQARGEGDPTRLGPREAASLGAQVVVVTPETARLGTIGG